MGGWSGGHRAHLCEGGGTRGLCLTKLGRNQKSGCHSFQGPQPGLDVGHRVSGTPLSGEKTQGGEARAEKASGSWSQPPPSAAWPPGNLGSLQGRKQVWNLSGGRFQPSEADGQHACALCQGREEQPHPPHPAHPPAVVSAIRAKVRVNSPCLSHYQV